MEEKSKKPKIRFKGFTESWEQSKLKETYKFQYGEFNNNPSNGGNYPVYGANGIIGGYTRYNTEDSVIIGHMGEYAGSVLWGNGKHFVTYNGTISKPKVDFINSKFGYYMLYQKDINKICGGSGLPFLSYEQLDKIEIYYPTNIEEQMRISKCLTNLDNLITLHQRKYDKLVNVKKSLLEKMFPKNDSNVPEIRFKGFTEAWEQCKLEDIIDLGSGKDYKHLNTGNIPVYGTGGYMLSVDKALSYSRDGIGIGRKGTIDKPYILKAPFWTVDTLFYALCKTNNNINFVYALFQKINWKEKDESTGVPSLSKSAINDVSVYTTKTAEQNKISVMFENIDNLITLHQRKLEKLKNIKKSLLEKMFI